MTTRLLFVVQTLLFACATSHCSSGGSSSNGDAGPSREAGTAGADGSGGDTEESGAGASTEAGGSCGVSKPGCGAVGCQVFETMNANFQGSGMSLASADQLCQTEAGTRGLSGTFKAWLSDKACSAAARFTHAEIPYVSVDNGNATIASNWATLVSGTLAAPISPNGYSSVATGTNPDGSAAPLNCQDWSGNGSSEDLTYPGDPTTTSGAWTFSGAFMSCSNAYALYCFEQ